MAAPDKPVPPETMPEFTPPPPKRFWPCPDEIETEWEPPLPDYFPEHVEPDKPWPR